VGIDIGGTFTDFAALDERDGRLITHKQLTTPADPAASVLSGLPRLLAKAGIAPHNVAIVVHGTTLVTNAIIERRGARTGMLVTAGFRDVLDIALERRYDLYDLRATYPKPLVPRALRSEIVERLDADGTVVTRLCDDDVASAITRLVTTHRIEALAICFLHAATNPAHELRAAAIARARFPTLAISTSAEIFPFPREYERWTTTVMNAFAQPMFDRYVARLEDGLRAFGIGGALFLMTSAGGMIDPATARRFPVRLLESGPAAGVLISAALGARAGARELLAFDMGGTTAKGALVRAGQPLKRYEMEVARIHEFKFGSGLPAKIPVIDLIEIGAGGGSIAALDARGMIAVGPRSAGADPGPACYARGGEAPTLTDANLVLGYLDPASFLGGEMALDRGAAQRAIDDRLATRLGLDASAAAWGIHETINEQVARAFRNHAAERGFDYRAAAMVAFGGSGPLHALRIARKLRVPRVIFPPAAGVLSAIGLLASPLAFEAFRAERVDLDELDEAGFERRFAALATKACAPLLANGLTREAITLRRALDIRFRGQGYDIEVALPDDADAARLPSLFRDAYARIFATAELAQPIEIASWKLEARGPTPERASSYQLAGTSIPRRAHARRRAWFPERGGFVEVDVHARPALAAGARITGPALIEERESTIVIGVGDAIEIDEIGNLIGIGPGATDA
jgi:N-methylhydantoinase A